MDYYQLREDVYVRNGWYLSGVQGVDRWALVRGPAFAMDHPVRDKVLSVAVGKVGSAVDFSLAGDALVPVASFKFVRALSGLDGFTAFPARIVGAQQSSSFYVLHFWDSADAVDEDLSVFEKYSKDDPVFADRAGDYSEISELVISKQKAEGKDVFRLSKDKTTLIVSENVKLRLESAKITGVKFDLASG